MTGREGTLKGASQLWASAKESSAIEENIQGILGAVTKLPLKYWKPGMFFVGAEDRELFELTGGRFPAKKITRKTHPIYSLKALPGNVGFKVCPCSSGAPFNQKTYRYISRDCRLAHTGHVMDRNSYLVDRGIFNIPRSVAIRLRFRGVVPCECLKVGRTGK